MTLKVIADCRIRGKKRFGVRRLAAAFRWMIVQQRESGGKPPHSKAVFSTR